MELKTLISLFKKYLLIIILVGIIGGLIGVFAYYLLPIKYVATGSFYVKRAVEPTSPEYFTYEGYYAQQTALSYTSTIMGLFESIDVKKKALESLKIPVDESSLRRVSRMIRVKKISPQLIILITKGGSPTQASSLWLSLSNITINTAQELNKAGDQALSVSALNEFPVVQEGYRNLYVNIIVGLLLGVFISTFVAALKEYLE